MGMSLAKSTRSSLQFLKYHLSWLRRPAIPTSLYRCSLYERLLIVNTVWLLLRRTTYKN